MFGNFEEHMIAHARTTGCYNANAGPVCCSVICFQSSWFIEQIINFWVPAAHRGNGLCTTGVDLKKPQFSNESMMIPKRNKVVYHTPTYF